MAGGNFTTTAPELPDPTGKMASFSHTAAVLTNTEMFTTSPGAPISQAEMFNTLQRSASEGYELSSVLNRAANMAVIAGKKAEDSGRRALKALPPGLFGQ